MRWPSHPRPLRACWIRTPGAARRAAYEILRAVRRAVPFDAALDAAIADLTDADRRLAHEIAAGVLRSRTELDGELARRIDRGWDRVADELRDVLRIGAYQLLMLERVPAHAAVDSAVELARSVRGAQGTGFVNAVLRRIARERPRRAGPRAPSAAGDGDAHALANRYSHPTWLVERWLPRFGAERTEALLARNNERPTTFLQPARWSHDDLRSALDAAGVPYAVREDFTGFAVRGRRIRELPGYPEGGFIVQDPAQARVARHANVPVGAKVWDACAAPGGKAAVLAAQTRVIASDRGPARVARLRETVSRAAPSVAIAIADATHPPFPPETMDAVILDVPCSATGTFARHPDARWNLSPRAIARLAGQQHALLLGVADVVRRSGVLVYSTCSLEPEENEDQVEAFLASRPDFQRGTPDLFIFPPDADTDGGYAARLVRNP